MEKDSLAFYELVGKLKSLPRAGWVRRGIPNPETVAEHMYRSQFIAYDLAVELGADPQRCSNMMMVHDLPEALAGDITPHCGVSKEEKARKEIEAAVYLAGLSGNNDYFELFMEYERKETLCAQICNDADKLECLVQALEYAKQYCMKYFYLGYYIAENASLSYKASFRPNEVYMGREWRRFRNANGDYLISKKRLQWKNSEFLVKAASTSVTLD